MESGKIKTEAPKTEVPRIVLSEGHMFFQDGIKWVLDMMEIADSDNDWLSDAEFICKAITENMSEIDGIYKSVLQNLLSTATFFRGPTVDMPLDFDQYLRFQMPFRLIPIFNPWQTGYVHLYSTTDHPTISNNYLNPETLQLMLRCHLRHAIEELCYVYCNSGVVYALTYRTHEIGDQGFVHEIMAYEQREFGLPSVISFVFLPALQFNFTDFPLPLFVPSGPLWPHCNETYYWLALLEIHPHCENRNFCPIVPRMQFVQDERMVKYRSVLRLLLRIGMGNNLPNVSDIFVLKGLHFYRHRYGACCDCNLSLATLFMDSLTIHTDVVYYDALQKFLAFGSNQQSLIRNALKLDCITRNASMFYYMNCIHVAHLKHLFGII